ncbi:hypothetical protein OVA14_10095 [Agrococcus sp. SL85]|uniref:DUF6993 domain-containing protein n=1 Tax=Agrococcus sp. SL85 TaxID=2995141 RepID=UPI00226C8C1D|nr:hypothetical protein [Agrococcus sp. SL85]WAC65678.1 hypothetical protein OVA14_10095 [Agrococcus sp. SL85]
MRQPAITGRRAAARLAALGGAAALVLGLAGCGDAGPLTPAPTSAEPAPAPAGSGSPAPTAPSGEEPAGDEAADDPELAAFRAALEGRVVSDPAGLVDAIEAAGFDRAAIERTRELDSLGAPVTFVEVAVRLDGSCLVGQIGDGEPMAMRTGVLGGGRCLIGSLAAP